MGKSYKEQGAMSSSEKGRIQLLKDRIKGPKISAEVEKVQRLRQLFIKLCKELWEAFKAHKIKNFEDRIKEAEKHNQTDTVMLLKEYLTDFKSHSTDTENKIDNCQKIILPSSVTARNYITGVLTNKTNAKQQIAGAILFKEKQIGNPLKVFESIIEDEVLDKFNDVYSEGIDKKDLFHSYLFYYWQNGYVSFIKFKFGFDQASENEELRMNEAVFYTCNKEEEVFFEESNNTPKATFSLIEKTFSDITLYCKKDDFRFVCNISKNVKRFFGDEVSHATYLSASEGGNISSCGIGIFIRYDNVDDEIKAILERKRVDDTIYSKLHQRSLYISDDERHQDRKSSLINFPNIGLLQELSGSWKVQHYRIAPPDDVTHIGEIEVNLFKIDSSGHVELKYRNDTYVGFINVLVSSERKLIKCYLHHTTNNISYRFYLFLLFSEEHKILEGVFSGWTIDNKPFTTLIQLKKLDKSNNVTPEIIDREALSNLAVDPETLQFLNNSKGYLIFPLVLSSPNLDEKEALNRFSGIFYLLSRHVDFGYYIKAKLEISDGGFIVEYEEVIYTGEIREIDVTVEQWYLLFNIHYRIHKRADKTKSKPEPYSGCFYFCLGKAGLEPIFDNLADRISYLSGTSLRINFQGKVSARKEYMVAAKNYAEFTDSKKIKISFAEKFELIKNVKDNNTGDFEQWFEILTIKLISKENNLLTTEPAQDYWNLVKEASYADLYLDAFLFRVIYTNDISSDLYNSLLQVVLTFDAKQVLNKLQTTILSPNDGIDNIKVNSINESISQLYKVVKNVGSSPENLNMFHKFLNNIIYIEIIKNDQLIFPVLDKIIRQIRSLNKD